MIKITITKEKKQKHIFEISQYELDAMLNHIHNKECDHKIKNFFIDIGANPNAIGISMYNVITMTPDQARSAMINEFEQDEPNIELIKNILDHSVIDINYEDTYSHEFNSYPLLHIASTKGYVEIVRMMLEKPEIDVNLQDKDGNTALIWASRWGHTEVVKLLLERPEIRVNLQTKDGSTAFICASYRGHTEIVKLLLKRPEIRVNLQTKDGSNALIGASGRGDTEIVKMLLERPEIDVNVQKNDGWTALMWASYMRHIKIVKLLLDRPEIRVNMQDEYGWTALTCILKSDKTMREKAGIIELLLSDNRVDVSIKNKKGKTAWDIADDDIKKLYPQLKPSTQS